MFYLCLFECRKRSARKKHNEKEKSNQFSPFLRALIAESGRRPIIESFFIQDKKKEGAMLVTVEDKNFNYKYPKKNMIN